MPEKDKTGTVQKPHNVDLNAVLTHRFAVHTTEGGHDFVIIAVPLSPKPTKPAFGRNATGAWQPKSSKTNPDPKPIARLVYGRVVNQDSKGNGVAIMHDGRSLTVSATALTFSERPEDVQPLLDTEANVNAMVEASEAMKL